MDETKLPDGIIPSRIKIIMLCDALSETPETYFYGSGDAPFVRNTLTAFRNAGLEVSCIGGIVRLGVYLTSAVKKPRKGLSVPLAEIKAHSSALEKELALFPGLKAILLMGDTAIKAVNIIAVRNTGTRAVPAGSTYKIRNGKYFYRGIRLFPSYLHTGQNFLIEKAKQKMAAEDIRNALETAGTQL